MPPKRTVDQTEQWIPLADLGRTPLDGLKIEEVERLFSKTFDIKFPGWTNRGRGHFSASGIFMGFRTHLNYSEKTKKLWLQGRNSDAVYNKLLAERSAGIE